MTGEAILTLNDKYLRLVGIPISVLMVLLLQMPYYFPGRWDLFGRYFRVNFFKNKAGQKYLVEYTMDDLESMLDPKDWFRISRQFLVSVSSVTEIHPFFNSRLRLHLTPKEPEEVTVSRDRVNDFKVWMGK